MSFGEIVDIIARMEGALAGALEAVTERGTPEQVERILNLLIKKEIVLEQLLDKFKSKVAYGTFWQDNFLRVPINQPFAFNHTGPTAGGITLLNSTTIGIAEPGDYMISYYVSYNLTLSDVDPDDPTISLLLNNQPLPNAQDDFGILIRDNEFTGCTPIVGEVIVSIPANSTLQLINTSPNGQDIFTCDNGINAATLNIVKIGP
jgi:hypothetical protein